MLKSLLVSVSAAVLLFGLITPAGHSQGVGQAMLLRFDGPTDNNSELRYMIGDPSAGGVLGNPGFPNNPTTVAYVTSLLSPINISNNGVAVDRFGYLMTGYIRPTNTGTYRFAVASDDPGMLFLSTDANPANLRLLGYTQGSSGVNNFNNTGHRRAQSGEIFLEAGRYYYFEALQRDNTGGDGLRVDWRQLTATVTNVPNAAANTTPGLAGTFLTTALNPGPAGFYGQPTNTVVQEGGTAIFEALFDGNAPFDFEWFVNGVGQGPQKIYTRRSVLVLPGQTSLDSGKTVSIVSTNALGVATSSNVVLSVVADTTPPTIDEAIGALTTPTSILLRFSEAVNPASFTTFELEFADGVMATVITPDPVNPKVFTITTDRPVTNGTSLKVTAVSDLSGNPAVDLTKTIIMNEGTLRWEIFSNRSGGNLNDLITDPNYPRFPSGAQQITSFATTWNIGDTNGSRVRGYIRVGKTGDYRIGLTADDNGALFLSPDSDPAHAQPICGIPNSSAQGNYNRHRTQQSVVRLTEGVLHYVEVLQKENTGGDGLEAAMIEATPLMVADAYPRKYLGPITNGTPPLSGVYLNPYREEITIDPTLPLDIAAIGECMPPQVLQARMLTGAVVPGQIQWYNAADNSPIAGAASLTLSLPVPLTNGIYYCVIGNDINVVTSRTATVTVPVYIGGPSVVSAAAFDNSTVVAVTFDRVLDVVAGGDPFNYSVVNPVSGAALATVVGVTNIANASAPINALSSGPGARYLLTLDSPVTPPLRVVVSSVIDCGGRPVNPAASEFVVQSWGSSMSIGLPHPGNVNLQGTNFPISVGNVDVRVPGADIWGTADQFHFIYKLVTGDFDVRVKTPYLERPDVWSKSGLMVRETLAANSRMLYAVTADYTTAGFAQHALGRRDTTGGSAAGWPSDPRPGVARENSWVRLKRAGNTFTSYQSTNGVYWQPVSSYAPAWGGVESGPLYLGLCTTSHNTNLNTTAQYRDYGTFTYPGAAITIVQQPQPVITPQASTASFSVTAAAVNAPQIELAYQWQRSDGAGGFTNVPGATTATLQTGLLTIAADNGSIFRVVMKLPGATETSAEALLTVVADTFKPKLLYAASLDTLNVAAVFSEPIDPSAAADAFRWTVAPGVTVISAALNPTNPVRVDLVLDPGTPLTAGATYTVTAGSAANGYISDVAGNNTDPAPAIASFVAVTNYLAGVNAGGHPGWSGQPEAAKVLSSTLR